MLAQIAIVYLVTAFLQQGDAPWHDGTALWYALSSERLVSAAGAAARTLPPGVLSAWTRVLWASAWMIPALIFVPFAWRITRGVAVALGLFYGLALGVFFELGLYGWSLAAASLLLIPAESWDRLEGQARATPRPHRHLRRRLRRLPLALPRARAPRSAARPHLPGQRLPRGPQRVRDAASAAARRDLPAEVTAELVADHRRRRRAPTTARKVFTRARAVAQVVQALPLGWSVAWAMRLPGVVHLLGALYDVVAARRQRISVLMGKEACGIPPSHEEPRPTVGDTPAPPGRAPATATPPRSGPRPRSSAARGRLRRGARGLAVRRWP